MKIVVINGPNLNKLEFRDSLVYGSYSLKNIKKKMKDIIKKNNKKIKFKFYQTNYEGKIIDLIQKNFNSNYIIINAAGYTHSSISIMDTLLIYKNNFNGKVIEVHLSNVKNREEYRQFSYIEKVADIAFFGKKENSYFDAINYILKGENYGIKQ